jgi:hypothetical protein
MVEITTHAGENGGVKMEEEIREDNEENALDIYYW